MMNIRSLTCREAFQRLDDYLDRRLTAMETAEVRQHLAVCSTCAAEFAYEASVIAHLKAKLRRIAIPPDLAGNVAAALERAAHPQPPRPAT